MEIDWKKLVGTVSPILGTLAGGPLVGGVVKVLADSILGGSSGDQAKDEAALSQALSGGLTPELRSQILAGEQQVKLAVIAADIRKAELATESEKTYIADVADARAHNANTVGILRLGYLINASSYLCVIIMLYGVYRVMTGNGLDGVDPNVIASVALMVGGIVQWLFSNAQQANGFFFGSSPSSRQAVSQLSSGVSSTVTATTKVSK